MSLCGAQYTWQQGRGAIDPRRGRIHRCILEAGHEGGHLYEATTDRAPTFFAWLPRGDFRIDVKRAPIETHTPEEHLERYRNLQRKKAWR